MYPLSMLEYDHVAIDILPAAVYDFSVRRGPDLVFHRDTNIHSRVKGSHSRERIGSITERGCNSPPCGPAKGDIALP